MKKTGLLFIGMVTGLALAFGILSFAPSLNTLAASSTDNNPGAGLDAARSFDDINLATPTPLLDMGSDELPPPGFDTSANAVGALPTPIPGESLLYFVPTDNDASATVLYLYNTETVTHTVALRGFSYNGVLVYSLNITLKPTSFLRLASDSIASAPPPSWATPAPIITNFTDFTYLASLSLPKGVKAEGYVLFNPGTGVVNPREDQGAIPLRFSTDPATLFLPYTQSSP